MRLLIAAVFTALVCAEATVKPIFKQNGDSLDLSCNSTGTIQWRKDGDDPVTRGVQSSSSDGKWSSSLIRENISSVDGGNYECYTVSTERTSINQFSVHIISLSGESVPLVVNTTSTELMCTVETDQDVASIMWKRNDLVLNNTEKYMISKANDSRSSTIKITKPGADDAGAYNCVVMINGTEFSRILSLDTKPEVMEFEKLRSKVEGETAVIECNVTGYPIPEITWYRQLEDTETKVKVEYDERVNATENSDGVPHAKLMINKLKIKTDRGDYTCKANNSLGEDSEVVSLKVKDKLAAVWPFLGICAEVAILCSIIFIFEKRRNRRMEEEEEVDAVKHDLMNQSNGKDEVRQRTNAAAAGAKA